MYLYIQLSELGHCGENENAEVFMMAAKGALSIASPEI